ncbi:SURF1 family protein [soil metagenome]
MYRFLLTRRWLALAVVAVVVAVVCARLGMWQLHRLEDRRADNAIVEANRDVPPVSVTQLVPVGRSPVDEQEWRRVSVRGRYDPADQLLVRYQSRGSLRGVHVVAPMVLADGSAVLVDRGFLESFAGTPDSADVPAPPAGTVTVTGWLRVDSDAPAEAVDPSDGAVRAVAAPALADAVDAPLRGGWVQALSESPPGESGLLAPEPPETDIGPHLFYALQWFLFGLLALLAYGWFAYDEAHPHRRRRRSAVTGERAEEAAAPSVVHQARHP